VQLSFWIRLPRWLPQALRVRKHALRLPPAAGPLIGAIGVEHPHKPPLRVLGLGDSVVAGVGIAGTAQTLTAALASALQQRTQREVHWEIMGCSGFDSGDLCRKQLPQLPGRQLDVVLISMGVNDVTGLTSTRRWQARMGTVLDTLSARYPAATLLLCGIPPMACFPALPSPLREALGMRAARLDACYAALARERRSALHVATPSDLPSSAFAPDGFHPNAQGCVALADMLCSALAARGLGPFAQAANPR